THPEETRVAVVDGRKLEEFDVEVASRHPLKGNIYLAKVTRVEPSLQAAFVEYGGNRHGFLAFSEIQPDYYRIPVADREARMREEYEEGEAEGAEAPETRDPSPEQEPRQAAALAAPGDAAEVVAPQDVGPQDGTGDEAAFTFTPASPVSDAPSDAPGLPPAADGITAEL